MNQMVRTLHRNTRALGISASVLLLLITLHTSLLSQGAALEREYYQLESPVTRDTMSTIISVGANARGARSVFAQDYPTSLRTTVLAQEDQWFYYHPGVNPVRLGSALFARARGQNAGGASTITQQLAKILLNTGDERTLSNKVRELGAAFVLEYVYSKDTLLTMYLNTVPLGGRVMGMREAARTYYDKEPGALSESEVLALVAAIERPAVLRPNSDANLAAASALAGRIDAPMPLHSKGSDVSGVAGARFELASLGLDCDTQCTTTIDDALTKELRSILARHLAGGASSRMTHGAIVVLKVPENEVLAMVGSPDPYSGAPGTSINMALEPRPIGSTIKPFIYLKGFEQGLRPYSSVVDRELKFDVATGFPIYPRNYDGTYSGAVTLDTSLSNSLNVPPVEVLRFITLPVFYRYLEDVVGLKPSQPWEHYAYGIALGGLELDLLTLTHAFSALASGGELAPLHLMKNSEGESRVYSTHGARVQKARPISERRYVTLVNTLLTDRALGVSQFGARSSLNLTRDGYAVKTGTSRDYHDSWTIGYTPEFVVGVWMGNAENKPMRNVSGMRGAGSVWHDAMELMFTTPYYSGKKLSTEGLVQVSSPHGLSWGLPGESPEAHRNLLLRDDLILFPHDGDVFLLEGDVSIPLQSSALVTWYENDTRLTDQTHFSPSKTGTYTLSAWSDDGREESVQVSIVNTTSIVP